MYNKLKQNEGIVLRPMLEQLDDLQTALLRENPAMLAVNPDLHPTQIKTLLQRSAMPAFGQSARLDMREALRQAMHSRVQRDG